MHKIFSSVDYNLWLKRLEIQLNKPTNQNPLKVPEVVKPTIRKRPYLSAIKFTLKNLFIIIRNVH